MEGNRQNPTESDIELNLNRSLGHKEAFIHWHMMDFVDSFRKYGSMLKINQINSNT